MGGYESKNKEAIKNMQDLADRTSNIEQVIEKKLLTVDDKLTDHSNRLNSLQESNNLQNQKVGNFEGLSDKVNHIEDNIKSFEENYNALMININKFEARDKKMDDSMMAIMEQANATLINDAQQDSKIKTLEMQHRSLEDKLSSLESADLFLQESYRQITDLYFEINELQQEKLGLHEKLDEMEGNMEKNINVVGAIEKNIPEIIKKITSDVDDKMKDIKDSNENNT